MPTKPYVVVVGTDFSEQAARGLRAAHELALRHAPAELHVAHAWTPVSQEPSVLGLPIAGLSTVPPRSMDDQRQELKEHLERQLAPLLGASPQLHVVGHLLIDAPSLALTRLANQLEADMVVVGTHGRHGVARWLLGSVAEGVVRQAPCPVLVVPPESQTLAVPAIEPACPHCVAARQTSAGSRLWCDQHSERHGRRHTYHQSDRAGADTNMPLVLR